MSTFSRATSVQVRVIGALMLRDLVAEGGSGPLPFFTIFLRPVVIIGALFAIGSVASNLAPQGIPLLVFIITGYLTWLGFLRSFSAIRTRGSAKLLMFPHVTPLDLVLSKMCVELVIYSAMFIAFCAIGILFEQATPPADPLGVIVAFWSAIAIGVSLGLIASSLSRFTTLFDDLFIAIRMVGHFLSGVFALATDTPTVLLNVLQWNPLFHCIEWIRQSWWAAYKSPIADPGYVGAWVFFLLAVGLAFERATRRWEAA